MKFGKTVCLFAVVLLILAADTVQAGWLFGFRRARACNSGTCVSVGAVQKESAVQKEAPVEKAVQKTEAIQKEEAVQKEAVQKTDEPVKESVQKSASTEGGTLYALCLRKARIQAARGGRCFHPGGGFGGARAEGVGSAGSASAALANCCFTGQRRLAASAVVQGANGRWYACKLFW